MASISDDRQLVPTILDRLLDDNPGQAHDPLRTSGFLLRELKKSVRRDLENLLNTRYRCREIPTHLEELETSLLNYGIPDFTGAVFANEDDRKELRRIIERIIRRFEPRFKEVTVHLDTKSTSNDRVIRFRIDALLHADPAPEPVVFDSQLEPSSNLFFVSGGE
jgi:type VI secretion system protein ImpF